MDDIIVGRERMWLIVSHVNTLPPVHDYLEKRYELAEWWGYRGIIIFLFDVSEKVSR
jgi:hypothetical protein